MADRAHQETGARYYVMPLSRGKLIVMDKLNFRQLRHKGYVPRDARVGDLERECFYFTPYRDGSRPITEDVEAIKREEFFRWYEMTTRSPKKKKA